MKSIFINPSIDGISQNEINKRFSENFEIVKNHIQPPSVVEVLPENEYGIKFVRAGVVMFTKVDVDYEEPDLEFCKDLILKDFSSKILTIFKENPYGMRKNTPHCHIYEEIDKRWLRYYDIIPITHECKQILKLTNTKDNIAEFIVNYIEDYLKHNYLGKDVQVPSVKDVINWCGGGEFPFLEVYLIRDSYGNVTIAYYLAR